MAGATGGFYDPSDLSTLFQDAAATTRVTAADQPVGRYGDKSGAGRDATQSGDAARPILREIGGARWLEFDGVDDLLTTPIQTPSAGTIVAALRPDVAENRSPIGSGAQGDTQAGIACKLRADGEVQATKCDGTSRTFALTGASAYSALDKLIIAIQWDTSMIRLRVNDGAWFSTSSAIDPATTRVFVVGAQNAEGNESYDGLFGQAVFADAVTSDAVTAGLERYAAAKARAAL